MNIVRNWKTSVFGALMLALAGFSVYQNPSAATDPNVYGLIAGGAGLLFAPDAKKDSTTQEPEKPALFPPDPPIPPGRARLPRSLGESRVRR